MTTTHIALLRAINVAGNATVAMADLRAVVSDLGFGDVRSLLQTGNLVFDAGTRSSADLERRLEVEAAKRLGLNTTFFVRTAKEWAAAVAANPFPKQAGDDPAHLVMHCLKDAPPAAAVKALQAAIKGRETVRAKGEQLYVVYPDGIGRSKLTMAMIERALGTRATGRNWNTVLKLAALATP